jgi:hypothetical protein
MAGWRDSLIWGITGDRHGAESRERLVVDIFSSIFSALVGGAISSSVITYVLGARRAEREILRNKLEGLYIEISRDMRHMHVEATRMANEVRKIDQKQALPEQDAVSVPGDEVQPRSDEHNTLINIYFPEAIPAYEKYFSTYQAINSIRFGAGLDFVIDPENSLPRYAEIMVKTEDLTRYAKELHTALLYEADKINCSIFARRFISKRSNPHF